METRQYLADFEQSATGSSQAEPNLIAVSDMACLFDRCFEVLQAVGAETARLRHAEDHLPDPD